MNRPGRPREIAIWSEYITLGQLLKMIDFVSSGSDVKIVLAGGNFTVNGEAESRRGRKLRPGDLITMPDGSKIIVLPPSPAASSPV